MTVATISTGTGYFHALLIFLLNYFVEKKYSANFAAEITKTLVMPQISSFYGILIWINYNDHMPPHFHAWYGEYKVIVNINDGIVKGEMPGRALRMILEWLEDHREELRNNWELARQGAPLKKIEPLR